MAEELRWAEIQAGARQEIPRRIISTLAFDRPPAGLVFKGHCDGLVSSQLPAFQSNGGPSRKHPHRSLPYSIESVFQLRDATVKRISLLGVFALYAGNDEPVGTIGAILQGFQGSESAFKFALKNGQNYFDAWDLNEISNSPGDGTSIQTVGRVPFEQQEVRVDLVTIDVSQPAHFDRIVFTDLGTPASFVIFDMFVESQPVIGCPFHEHSGGVPLAELASVIRLRDRVRFSMALDQLDSSIDRALDLDEAKGQALTFLSILTAATLELGGSRNMVRVGLNAARELDKLKSAPEIKLAIKRMASEVALPYLQPSYAPSEKLVERSIRIIERNFVKSILDDEIAKELGISTSHFRYIFKQTTGQPFHQYLIALRLERAYKLLVEGDLQVTQVSSTVGFSNASHFSRAFHQRFKVSPASLRRGQPATAKSL